MKKIFSVLLKLILGFILILVVALGLAVTFGVTVDLSFLKPGIEKAAQSTLEREVEINGPVIFEFANWTAIDVRDVHIDNVPNAKDPDFFTAGIARLEIGLIPLLRGKIHISEIRAENITLNLQNDKDGEPNWVFGEEKPKADKNTTPEPSGQMISFGGVDKLSFKEITLNYHDEGIDKKFKAQLKSMTGEMSSGKPIIIDLDGKINKTPFDMSIKGLPYNQFMDKTKPWAFKLDGQLGGKEVRAKGELLHDNEIPEINMALGVKDVDVGNILSTLGLIEDLSASVRDATFKVSLNYETYSTQ